MLELLNYQKEIVKEILFKRKGRALLWASVGTGKTAIALKAFEEWKTTGMKCLYLTPSILREQVYSETRKFTSLRPCIISGTTAEKLECIKVDADLFITNYETLRTNGQELFNLNFEAIICDESSILGHTTSKTYKLLMKFNPTFRSSLSATPAPNALWELWGHGNFLFPGYFGRNFYSWRQQNCKMNPYYAQIIGYFNEKKVRKQFASFTIRLHREDVLKLPPLEEIRLEVEPDKKLRNYYEKMRATCMLEIKNQERITMPNALALLTRLRELIDCPSILGILDVVSPKEKVLIDIIKQTSGKIIVFTEHAKVIRYLQLKFGGLLIDGEVSMKDREQTLRKFKIDKNEKLLFSTAAGAYGLNLTESQTVVHYQLPWNYSRVMQREGRIYRMGQLLPCKSYRIITRGTIDEKMERLIAKKRKLTTDDLIKIIV